MASNSLIQAKSSPPANFLLELANVLDYYYPCLVMEDVAMSGTNLFVRGGVNLLPFLRSVTMCRLVPCHDAGVKPYPPRCGYGLGYSEGVSARLLSLNTRDA